MLHIFIKYILKKSNIRKYIMVLMLSMVSISITLYMPIHIGQYLDLIINENRKDLQVVFIQLLCLIFTNIIISYIYGVVVNALQLQWAFDFFIDVFEHIQKISIIKVNEFDAAYINHRLISDTNEIISFLLNNIREFIKNTISLVIAFIVVGNINKKLIMYLIILVPVYFFIYFIFKKKVYYLNHQMRNNQNLYFSITNEQFKNIYTIKVYSLYEETKKLIVFYFKKLKKIYMKYMRTTYLFLNVETTITSIIQMMILFWGGVFIIKKKISVGDYSVINMYFMIFFQALSYFINVGKAYQNCRSAVDRINEFMNMNEEFEGNEYLHKIENIEVRNVSFGYNEKKIIQNFSCTFQTGKIYAITGENGRGKTSLMNLIIGIIKDNYKGDIIYNGKNIKTLNMKQIRKNNIYRLKTNRPSSED